jgi:plastocyanin
MRRTRGTAAGIAAALIVLLLPAVAAADPGGSVLKVRMNDDCDPVTWTVGATVFCAKPGGTSPAELVAAVQKDGADGAWWINPRQHTIDKGDTIEVSDNGGLPHTFTEVKQFGGACFNTLAVFPDGFPAFNDILGIQPVAECANLGAVFASLVAPGGPTVTISNLSVGTHLFQCVFHPWMHSKITVRDHT